MSEVANVVSEQLEEAENSKLNSMIAIIVAISASLVAIFNIKDNNIVQAMSQAQAHAIDTWAFYQAKSTKQHMAENVLDQLRLQSLLHRNSPQILKEVDVMMKENQVKVEKYEREKAELKTQAEGFQSEYEQLNVHDDQFDMAEALISLGLSIFGITALTRKKPLFYFGLVFSLMGMFFGLAGFLEWNFRPEWLAKFLG